VQRPSESQRSDAFGAGVSEDDVLEAVARSGYPLQTVIGAHLLRKGYSLAEEWAYVDADTGEPRTLDLLAGRGLQREFSKVSRGQLTSGLTLLIECKQAELPYVGFEAVTRPEVVRFPRITGLPVSTVGVGGDDPTRRINVGIPRVLGLNVHRFATEPPMVSSLSGAARKGKRVELSGDQPYRSLILPLTKALEHFASIHSVQASLPDSGGSWVADLAIPIGVVDAPLVLAKTRKERPEISLVPWIRVIRRHPRTRRTDESRVTLVDVVHKDFFGQYLSRYLAPYARAFQQRLTEHADSVLSFDAVRLPGFDLHNPPTDLHRRLSSRKRTRKTSDGDS